MVTTHEQRVAEMQQVYTLGQNVRLYGRLTREGEFILNHAEQFLKDAQRLTDGDGI